MKKSLVIGVSVRILLGLFAILGVVGLSSAYAEKKIAVEEANLPAEIGKVVKEAFPNGKIVSIEQEVEGEDPGQWDILVRSEEKEYELEIDPKGVVKESKEVLSEKDEKDESDEKDEAEESEAGEAGEWTESFYIDDGKFRPTGRNRFFVLEPGYRLVIESQDEKVAITVLDETKDIGGIKTRVVEEREWGKGELKEVSRNFCAFCKETGDVFYFGEEVDTYEGGKVTGHGGAWRADEKDSKAGIIMPGRILLGARYYQEIAPGAMDRAEIKADDVTLETPAGTFRNCIRVEETSPLEPGSISYKTYAPGIGLIQDEDLLMTEYSTDEEAKVSLEDVPAEVRASLEEHADGGKIVEIERETKDGQIVYEAEVQRDGKEFDIKVSDTGKYLETEEKKGEIEREDEGDLGKEDKDEADEEEDEEDQEDQDD